MKIYLFIKIYLVIWVNWKNKILESVQWVSI